MVYHYKGGGKGYRPQSGGYNKGYNGGYRPAPKRRTGCTRRTYVNKDGEQRDMIRGFRPDPIAKSGFESAIAVPQHDTSCNNGNEKYQKWVVTIQNCQGRKTYNGLYNISKGFVTIPDLGLILSPNGKGTYGRITKRK